jgi:catechol 2,3-dioxygenase-like lactoylglutathione lyase family enzyme
MGLHRLTDITIGVPNVDETARYYTDFGLTPAHGPSEPDGHRFRSLDGGRQLRIVHRPARQLLSLGVGAQNPDDIDRISASLARLGIAAQRAEGGLQAVEPATGLRVDVSVAPPIEQAPTPAPAYNAPGAIERSGARSPAIRRPGPVRPRKLGHVVFGSVDQESTQRFFVEGLGFKVSDEAPGLAAFMRCSTDHHNVLVQQAPVNFLHHTSWEVDDVDEIGRGATAMLDGHPERHVWGLGRHYIGSNFFWYLRDPAGNFSEYYSDLDCILDDQLWEPGVVAGERGLYAWGPPPPPSFLHPDDLADLMTGAHQ